MAAIESAHRLAPLAEDYRCANCGYGAVLSVDRPRCPMCQSEAWLPVAHSPGGRDLAFTLDYAERE